MRRGLALKADPTWTALLVIDMQEDFCREGGSFDRRGFDIKAAQDLAVRLNRFLVSARKALASIVHVKMTKIPELASEANTEHYRRLGVQRGYDPSGSEFFGVLPEDKEVVIPKTSHSAFYQTYLDRYLRSRNIKSLILTGVAANVCVEATARDAYARDYHVVVPGDLTEGTDRNAKEASLKNIDLFFGEVIESADLLACWKRDG